MNDMHNTRMGSELHAFSKAEASSRQAFTALEKAKSMWTTFFLIAELHKPLDKARVKRSIVMRSSEPYQRAQR
jgi:hypothetical protein